jgi:hypothetical protein
VSQTLEVIHPFDSCHRCGLRRRTRELEAQGIVIRLCDDCYWGREEDDMLTEDPGTGAMCCT